ncbi:MAG: Wzz/FepE/Etk N-terminal domain-containing protein [Actinomyces sp.]|uniref:YveK family protein n=1 Tax=Actinomyces sp. TaxID=29317 RepID=UPI0026DB68AE|nr:Wzz/FepE/Etk N-terminal domain-containing protein [Actinomyces sp.]MDO4243469.1 Wzz/FepE/Etk N-terminal domain-containing protein [Actinomyces sp.]
MTTAAGARAPQDDKEQAMEPDEILNALRRHIPLVLVHLVLGLIAGLVLAAASTPVYTSRASALVAADPGDGTQSVTSSTTVISAIMPTLIEVGTSETIIAEVAESTGMKPSQIRSSVELSNATNSLIVEVTARASNAEDAQTIAKAEIEALRGVVSEMSVKGQEEELALTLTDVDTASLPGAPSGPSKSRYALIGAALGAMVGAGVALVLHRRTSATRGTRVALPPSRRTQIRHVARMGRRSAPPPST